MQRQNQQYARRFSKAPYHPTWNNVREEPKISDDPYGTLVDSIPLSSLIGDESAPKIENVQYLASYNWVNGTTPIILVPGSPPAWTPPHTDTKLSPDSEDVFRDINAARFPTYPMEPAIHSILTLQPDFKADNIDILGCGSTFGNLMRYVGLSGGLRPFRFDVDIVGSMIILIRRERSPTDIIEGLYGYGHTFPDAYTTWDRGVANSCSHQRIVQYDFARLKIAVRTETDAYIKDNTNNKSSRTPIDNADDQDILGTLGMLNINTKLQSTSGENKVQVKSAGTIVQQDQVFDIKTRAQYKVYDLEEIIPRLWLNQTPNFLIAYHERGLFDKPEVKDVKVDVARWQENNAVKLEKFHALLNRIVEVMLDDEEAGPCEISYLGSGPLRITKQIMPKRALPDELTTLLES